MMSESIKNPIEQHIGPKLREKRLELGLSQEELGKAVDITFQQIQKYEKSTNRISASTLYKLAQHLKVKINYFFDGIEGQEYNFDNEKKLLSLADIEEKYEGTSIAYEIEELLNAYTSVKDPTTRKSILTIVQTLSKKEINKIPTEKNEMA